MSLVSSVALLSILTATDSLAWTGMPATEYPPWWLHPRSGRQREFTERRRRRTVPPTLNRHHLDSLRPETLA
jgi:hypothetical protein